MIRRAQNALCAAMILWLFILSVDGQTTTKFEILAQDQNGDRIIRYSAFLFQRGDFFAKRLVANGASAEFGNLESGLYKLQVVAEGFKPLEKQIVIGSVPLRLIVTLEVNDVKESVSVELTARGQRFENSISKVYSADDISNLPNDPGEIGKQFARKYGNNVRFQVDGFFGGQIPDKSRIAAIKVIFDPVDAEFHFAGDPVVQITTRPGGKKWSGYFSAAFGRSIFNARNAFEIIKPASSENSVYGSVTPPALSKNTSLSFSFNISQTTKENSFIGVLPVNNIENDRRSSTTIGGFSVNLYQNLTKGQVGFFRYRFLSTHSTRIGLGPLDVSSRSADLTTRDHSFRYSQTGIIGENTNHFRAEFSLRSNQTVPIDPARAINILDTLNFGGSSSNSDSEYRTLGISDNFTFSHRRHLIKIGFDTSIGILRKNIRDNINGTFVFLSFNDFQKNEPLFYSVRKETAAAEIADIRIAPFIQDYVRLSEYFQIGIGLRYEWQNTVGNLDNFSPRLSFAWSPEKSGKFIMRAAFGILYKWLDTSDLLRIKSDNSGSSDLIFYQPGYPDPFFAGETPGLNIIKTTRQLSDEVKNPRRFYSLISPSYSFNKDTTLRIGLGFARTGRSFISLVKSRTDTEDVAIGQRRVIQTESTSQITEKNFVVGMSAKLGPFPLEASYLFNKTVNVTDSIFSLPSDSGHPAADIGDSRDLPAHTLNFSVQGNLGQLIDARLRSFNFTLGIRATSGLPYSITTGQDDNRDLELNDRPPGIRRNSLRGEWIFETNANLTWRVSQFDKMIRQVFRGSGRVSFRVSASNLLNKVNKKGYIGVQTSPFFRRPTFAGDPRSFLFGFDYSF
ncbi:MAG: hypothetical protein KDB79_16035 [Acidobacteria bacterium]|nr:hypothetical protein [Acidobacteriota bacterium]